MIAVRHIIFLVIYLFYLLIKEHYQFGSFPYLDSSAESLQTIRSQNPAIAVSELYVPVFRDNETKKLHAWLFIPPSEYHPPRDKGYPIVVMSHGVGGQKDMGLQNYGFKFASEGYAVLIFDYDHFGGSLEQGEFVQRNLVWPWAHADDIKQVVQYVHNGKLGSEIDTKNIILWGTSFAGGHVLKVANEVGGVVKAVISQSPFLSGRNMSKKGIKERGILGSLRVLSLSLLDFILSTAKLDAVYVRIVGSPGQVAYMTLSDADTDSYFSKHPKVYLGGWQNYATARSLIVMSLYNPVDVVKDIQAPILFITATKDAVCPPGEVEVAAKVAPNAEVFSIESSHFDIYIGQTFNTITDEMVKFLNKHVPVPSRNSI